MAALTVLVCSAIRELYDLADAFVRCGFNPTKSYNYYRTKRRLELFAILCRDKWLSDINSTSTNSLRQSAFCVKQSVPSAASVPYNKMQRSGIDFAAIEASAEAFEAIDNFGVGAVNKRGIGGGGSSSDCVNFLDAERYNFEIADNYDEIEVIDGMELNASFYEYSDTLPKYSNDQIGDICEGLSYTITGVILINCERFSINFVLNNEHKDIALHINPRLPQNYVVRNTRVQEVWGREEVSSALPFTLRRGDRFSIQVLVTEACYMISVNGQHFAEYNHRLPYRAVGTLEVRGDVENIEMERSMVLAYPTRLPNSGAQQVTLNIDKSADEQLIASTDEVDGTLIPREWRLIALSHKLSKILPKDKPKASTQRSLSLPYYGVLPPKSMIAGRCLKIEGRVRLLPHSFYINLQQGQNIWPHQIIAFHFNPRFLKHGGAVGKAVVCRNAWYNGKWADEQRSELDTNFRPGKTFSMAIVCAADAFEVYVNRKFITDFKYQVKPDIIDTIYIQGDIKLWDVKLENNSLLNDCKTRIYQNPTYSEDF